jgi:hypothetical protein
VFRPTGYQILGKVEATGLCFSDLKLLKQFQDHPRKAPVISGMEIKEIEQIPSYVPHDQPTVPGHETVIRIVAVGDKVRRHKVGERCLVQTDYRGLPSALNGNASFGYNFEGGLQEYVLIDERVSRDFDTDESFLLPAREERSAAAIALVEPWACVEDSYQNPERQRIKAGGHLLVVADSGHAIEGLTESFHASGQPGSITLLCPDANQITPLQNLGIPTQVVENVEAVPNSAFDDIVYFGATPETIEALASKPGDGASSTSSPAGNRSGGPSDRDRPRSLRPASLDRNDRQLRRRKLSDHSGKWRSPGRGPVPGDRRGRSDGSDARDPRHLFRREGPESFRDRLRRCASEFALGNCRSAG